MCMFQSWAFSESNSGRMGLLDELELAFGRIASVSWWPDEVIDC